MKVTEKLKNQIQIAKLKGYNSLLVKRCKNYHNYAVVLIHFNNLIQHPTSTYYPIPHRGEWMTKAWEKNNSWAKYIPYKQLMKLHHC